MHIDRPLVFSKTRNETFAEYAMLFTTKRKKWVHFWPFPLGMVCSLGRSLRRKWERRNVEVTFAHTTCSLFSGIF